MDDNNKYHSFRRNCIESRVSFPTEFPYEFDLSDSNSALNSPIESMVSSTETEEGNNSSDEVYASLLPSTTSSSSPSTPCTPSPPTTAPPATTFSKSPKDSSFLVLQSASPNRVLRCTSVISARKIKHPQCIYFLLGDPSLSLLFHSSFPIDFLVKLHNNGEDDHSEIALPLTVLQILSTSRRQPEAPTQLPTHLLFRRCCSSPLQFLILNRQ
ncbi:hypothetical protein ACFXTN_030727 [Malus domestica]